LQVAFLLFDLNVLPALTEKQGIRPSEPTRRNGLPYHLTLWEAASSPRAQAFLLVGALFLLPVILTYTGWSYWVFRGKVRGELGYH
jgi:cytochrome bd-type quinol oxidase subunit 2